MKYTMKDIAKKANVSVTTVSLVLNNRISRISESKKREIKNIAKEMNYHPNSAAVSLSRQVSYNIALIVPDITNPFFSSLVKQVSIDLYSKGYNVLLFNSDNSYELERKAIQRFDYQGVDGILLVPSNEFFSQKKQTLNNLIGSTEKPIILLNAETDLQMSYVNFDNFKGAQMATQLLIDNNIEKIAFIRGGNNFVNANQRLLGYEETMKQNEKKVDKNLIFQGDYSMACGYKLASKILSNSDIKGIVSSNDLMLFGIIKWAKENDKDIFNLLAMVSFDNTPYSEILEKPLTTIDQDTQKMASEAVEVLLESINSNKKNIQKIIIDPHLIVRKSDKLHN